MMNELKSPAPTTINNAADPSIPTALQEIFIRNVNHELRTPLTVIQGYTELLRDGMLGELSPEQQQAIFYIANNVYELRALVERTGVLLAARSRAATFGPLSPGDLVAEVSANRQKDIQQAGMVLEIQVEPDLPPVQGDLYHLSIAVDCLVENAIKFSPPGSHILVHLYAEGGGIVIAVRDNGPGIAPADLERVLAGFRQGDESTTRRHRGLGLGLAVVRAVAEEHGGLVNATSQPGEGSCFSIWLPALSAESQLPMPQQSTVMRRILIVDDEESVLLVLREGLETIPNCIIRTATNGEKALELLEQESFDLLITDYKMPGTDGMTLATRVRQFHPQITIILITAYSSDELREQAARIAIRHVLDKPVRLSEVRSLAAKALAQPNDNVARGVQNDG